MERLLFYSFDLSILYPPRFKERWLMCGLVWEQGRNEYIYCELTTGATHKNYVEIKGGTQKWPRFN